MNFQSIAIAKIKDNIGSTCRGIGPGLRKVRNSEIKKPDRVNIDLKIQNDIVIESLPENKSIGAYAAPDAVISNTANQGVVSKTPVETVVSGVALQQVIGSRPIDFKPFA